MHTSMSSPRVLRYRCEGVCVEGAASAESTPFVAMVGVLSFVQRRGEVR